ncbi:MAG: DNA mismatch repair endonuclease MutL [Desulfobacterales bacterium]|nr:DNA mismatch repair endonuclease MutL [Desulfobacterales bacterium]
MSEIRILPEILSNKIAAGEVVERPASVVKELVENALDAKSTRIQVEVENGGKSLIRVSDDGSGMGPDDALLALERYATSKISGEQDLFSIQTLGFRGEALPSIAAVSKFSLISRRRSDPAGAEITVQGGKILKVAQAGAPPGTMVAVNQLFYNMPARRKFLKATATEMGHITDVLARMALGRPEVQFKLVHNQRVVKNWTPTDRPLDRVLEILGSEFAGRLCRIDAAGGDLAVSGWISSPRVTRSGSAGIHIYVNGRYVRDRVIVHGLLEGYGGRLMKNRFPAAALFITVRFDQVDVNVHPTKNEVRFAEPQQVHEAVKRAAAAALDLQDRPPWASAGSAGKEVLRVSEPAGPGNRFGALRPAPEKKAVQKPGPAGTLPAPERLFAADGSGERPGPGAQQPLWETRRFSDLTIIGQVHDSYIFCQDEKGLVLIDQHAAHERICFERLKKRGTATVPERQGLLIPETLELGHGQAHMLAKLIPELARLGFEIDCFGQNTFRVAAVPGLLSGRPAAPVLMELMEEMAASGVVPDTKKAADACWTIMACHSAIRAGQPLEPGQMRQLLLQLDACDNPSCCPHGRPVWLRWTKGFLEKAFARK